MRRAPATLEGHEVTQPVKKPRVDKGNKDKEVVEDVTKGQKKPRAAKGKKVIVGVDAVALGLMTRADVDAFTEWMTTDDAQGTEPARTMLGTRLERDFFGDLKTPMKVVGSEVNFGHPFSDNLTFFWLTGHVFLVCSISTKHAASSERR